MPPEEGASSPVPGPGAGSVRDRTYCGRMNDPSGSAYIKGLCGDEMELYLVVGNGRITDIRFYTDGCEHTKACAVAACELALGKSVTEALGVSAGQVLGRLKAVPRSHTHCAILAVSALYKAIADYLLKP